MNSANLIRQQIVQPVLKSIGLENQALETFLALLLGSPCATLQGRYGPFLLTTDQHWAVWDDYLAHDPERASLVRGFASQRRFLEDPDQELTLNWGYAVAIAALIIESNTDNDLLQLTLKEIETIWFLQFPVQTEVDLAMNRYSQSKKAMLEPSASRPCML